MRLRLAEDGHYNNACDYERHADYARNVGYLLIENDRGYGYEHDTDSWRRSPRLQLRGDRRKTFDYPPGFIDYGVPGTR